MTWNAGYVTDINYTFGYYNELNPLRVRQALLAARVQPPVIRNACELGFGQGLSAVMHGATQPEVTWWGTDFNPAQAGFASAMAAEADVTAHFFDQSFAEFCSREDLPQFEFIALHGIWTWISDENRAVIVDFVRRKLAVGGVLYISYNVMPGWAQAAPIRHLMREYGKVMAAPAAGIVSQIEGAIGFAERLIAIDAAYPRLNPQVAERVKGLTTANRNYLAHEYMNRDWRPMYFSEMADALGEAKLTYAGSCHLFDYQDGVNLTDEQRQMLSELQDPVFRETVRDYVTNQQFRRDIWVKGARPLSLLEQLEAMREEKFVLTVPRSDAPLNVKTVRGEAGLREDVYKPIYDYLADHQVRSFAEIEKVAAAAGVNTGQVMAAVQILQSAGALAPIVSQKQSAKAKASTKALNRALIAKARTSSDIGHLASNETAGGVAASRFEQLYLLAQSLGYKGPEAWAGFAADLLTAQGQSLVKEGVPVTDREAMLAELLTSAQEFGSKRLPIFKALGIA